MILLIIINNIHYNCTYNSCGVYKNSRIRLINITVTIIFLFEVELAFFSKQWMILPMFK